MPGLKKINLQGNQISFITKNLDKIKSLRSSDLASNQINDMDSLSFPESLKYLDCSKIRLGNCRKSYSDRKIHP